METEKIKSMKENTIMELPFCNCRTQILDMLNIFKSPTTTLIVTHYNFQTEVDYRKDPNSQSYLKTCICGLGCNEWKC